MQYKEDFMEWLVNDQGVTEEDYLYCLTGEQIKAYYDDFISKFKSIKGSMRFKMAEKCAKLAVKLWTRNGVELITFRECVGEYYNQLATGEYLEGWNLKSWLGCMVADGNKEAIEIMKDLIRWRLGRFES